MNIYFFRSIGLIHGFEIVECEVDARPGLVGSSAETMLSPKKPGDDLPGGLSLDLYSRLV